MGLKVIAGIGKQLRDEDKARKVEEQMKEHQGRTC